MPNAGRIQLPADVPDSDIRAPLDGGRIPVDSLHRSCMIMHTASSDFRHSSKSSQEALHTTRVASIIRAGLATTVGHAGRRLVHLDSQTGQRRKSTAISA